MGLIALGNVSLVLTAETLNMKFFSVTSCPRCGTCFRVVWRLHESQLAPSAVIKLTCPRCNHRFDRTVKQLQVLADGPAKFPAGLPVRHVKLIYDCPRCGKGSIAVRPMFTDCTDKELLQQKDSFKCTNPGCGGKGRPQRASVSRIVSL